MSLLCRIIGHKWTLKRHCSADGLRADRLLIFPVCLRCGTPAPDDLMQAAEGLARGERGEDLMDVQE